MLRIRNGNSPNSCGETRGVAKALAIAAITALCLGKPLLSQGTQKSAQSDGLREAGITVTEIGPGEVMAEANRWLGEAIELLREASGLREEAMTALVRGTPAGIRDRVGEVLDPNRASFESYLATCRQSDGAITIGAQIDRTRWLLQSLTGIQQEAERSRAEACSAASRVSELPMEKARALADETARYVAPIVRQRLLTAESTLKQAEGELQAARLVTSPGSDSDEARQLLSKLGNVKGLLEDLETRMLEEAPARRAVEKLNTAQSNLENARQLVAVAHELVAPLAAEGYALDSESVLEVGSLLLDLKDVDNGLLEAREYEARLLRALSSAMGEGKRELLVWEAGLQVCSGQGQSGPELARVEAEMGAGRQTVEQIREAAQSAEECARVAESRLQNIPPESPRYRTEPAPQVASAPSASPAPPVSPSTSSVHPKTTTQQTPSPAASETRVASAQWGVGQETELRPQAAPPATAQWGTGEVREMKAAPEPAVSTAAPQRAIAAPAPQTVQASTTPPPSTQPATAPSLPAQPAAAPVGVQALVEHAKAADEACAYDQALAIMKRIQRMDAFDTWTAQHYTEISVKSTRSKQATQELEQALSLMQQGKNAEAVAVLSRTRLNASPCDSETVDTLFRDAVSLTNRDRMAREQEKRQQELARQQQAAIEQQKEAEKREKRRRTWAALSTGLTGALQVMNNRSSPGGGGLAGLLGSSATSGKAGQIIQQLTPVVQQSLAAATGDQSGFAAGVLTPLLTGGQPAFPAGQFPTGQFPAAQFPVGAAQSCQVNSPVASGGGQYYVFRGGSSVATFAITTLRADLAAQLISQYQAQGWQAVHGPVNTLPEAEVYVNQVCPPNLRVGAAFPR